MTPAEFRAALAALGLSQKRLAALADAERTDGRTTPPSTLSRMASDDPDSPPVNPWLALYLRALAEARGIDLAAAPDPAPAGRTDAAERRRKTTEALRAAGLLRPHA